MVIKSINKDNFSTAVRARLNDVRELPPMPEVAHDLLRLRNRPDADILDLVKIVERDPALAMQVMRYAQLSIFGFGNRITSIQQAITITLGFDAALYLMLGIAAGQYLKTPNHGPLGRVVVWEHSLAVAALSQELAAKMPQEIQPPSGLCYLAGLMHDFGLLLLGHWYPQHYAMLNSLLIEAPATDVRGAELYAFGISHDTLGKHLMRAWNMPEEITVSCGEHHFPGYDGECAIFVKLISLTHQLLEHPYLNHSSFTTDCSTLLESLQLSETQAISALDKVTEGMGELSDLAQQIAA